MHDFEGNYQALLLIQSAADRIRRAYLDGTLKPATVEKVERALADLDRLGPSAADYADDIVRVGALQLDAARSVGGFQAADLQIEYAAAVLAAATIRGQRGSTRAELHHVGVSASSLRAFSP